MTLSGSPPCTYRAYNRDSGAFVQLLLLLKNPLSLYPRSTSPELVSDVAGGRSGSNDGLQFEKSGVFAEDPSLIR